MAYSLALLYQPVSLLFQSLPQRVKPGRLYFRVSLLPALLRSAAGQARRRPPGRWSLLEEADAHVSFPPEWPCPHWPRVPGCRLTHGKSTAPGGGRQGRGTTGPAPAGRTGRGAVWGPVLRASGPAEDVRAAGRTCLPSRLIRRRRGQCGTCADPQKRCVQARALQTQGRQERGAGTSAAHSPGREVGAAESS